MIAAVEAPERTLRAPEESTASVEYERGTPPRPRAGALTESRSYLRAASNLPATTIWEYGPFCTNYEHAPHQRR